MKACRVVVSLLTLGLILAPARAGSALGDTAVSRPNILLIVTDDQTLDSMPQGMPFLNSRPGGHWIEFSNAFLNTPLCCPSRATIFSGLYSHHTGVRTNEDADRFDDSSTIATWLQAAGYRTGLAGKYLNHYPFGRGNYIPPGWSDWFVISGPDDLYYNYTINDDGTPITFGGSAADYETDVLAAHAESFITSSAGQPFFLEVTPAAPHEPRTPAPRHANVSMTVTRSPNFNEADVSDKPAWVQALQLQSANGQKQWDAKRIQEFRTLRAVDDLVHRLYDALQSIGALDNTVIVFMTDNGLLIGEHRIFGKENVYEESVRTPMLIRYPWASDRVEPRLVSNVDLAPTFAELAGILPPRPVDGTSLVPLLEDSATQWRSGVLLEFVGPSPPGFWAIRTARWKYTELATGERELYDLAGDPYELQNVAGQPAYADVQNDLASQLAVLRTAPAHLLLPSVRVGDVSAQEATPGGIVEVPVSLSLATGSPVAVDFLTSDGTAVAGLDYASTVGTLTFPAGETTAFIDVPVLDDSAAEPDESFSVHLSGALNATIADGDAVLTILDDDDLPSIQVADLSVPEGDDGQTDATVTVSLSAPVADPVTVDYATADGSAVAGSDYVAAAGTIVFDPGDTSQVVPVTVTGDPEGEPDEAFFLDLTSPVNGTIGRGRGTVTIANDDPFASLAIDDVAVTEGAAGTTAATFTVSLSDPSEEPVTVDYATVDDTAASGSDYEATSGTLTLDPGEMSEQVTVLVDGDGVFEPDERFSVDLSDANVSVTRSRGVGTILNDEPLPTISVADTSGTEGNSGTKPFTFVLSLSGPSAVPITVSYATADDTARAGSDYTATSGVVTFSPLQTAASVVVSVIGDTTFEPSERFRLNLSGAVGALIADGQAIGTIANDDRKA